MRVTPYIEIDEEKQAELQKLIISLLRTYNQPMLIMNGLNIEDDGDLSLNIEGVDRLIMTNNKLVGVEMRVTEDSSLLPKPCCRDCKRRRHER